MLHYIDTDFQDFLLPENLERYDECVRHFRDKKSDVRFLHESLDFEKEYEKLKEKYRLRIERFLAKTRSRTCYLRSIDNEEEFTYIKQNAEWIRRVIQKQNHDSEIVFLCRKQLSVSDPIFMGGEGVGRCYTLPGVYSGASRRALRSYFDHADEFLSFCGAHYSGIHLILNLMFDSREEERLGLTERRYKTLSVLLAHDFSLDALPEKVMIYGAGIIGRELYRKIKDITAVECFIDRQKAGGVWEGIPIVSPDDAPCGQDRKILITACYDFENIKWNLLQRFQRDAFLLLDDLLGLHF